MEKILIWSVAWGEYRYMLQSLMDSVRRVGLQHDIITFSDEPLYDVDSYELDKSIELDFKQYWKFYYLNKIRDLDYDIFVFIDSDHYFVRQPSKSFLDIIKKDVWHSFLESPINSKETRRGDWWSIPNFQMEKIYRSFGVSQKTIYNTNGGFWMCRKEFIEQAFNFGLLFKKFQEEKKLNLPEEVAIAVMSHLFSVNYENRIHSNYIDIWASEWTGVLKDKLPDGSDWKFQEYMTHKNYDVNPAIVHAMRSKKALLDIGKRKFDDTLNSRKFSNWNGDRNAS
jgi:hypothetical protein